LNEILRGLLKPPIAKKEPRTLAVHGQTLVDDYGWLRDKTSADTVAYLEAENAYAEAVMASSAELQQTLYDEMLGRIRQTDISVPWRKGAYLYYSRTEEGKQYPIWARKRAEEAAEEIVLDVNELAEGKEFMALGSLDVSDDANLLLFSTDDTGYRQYTLQVKDLRTGELLPVRVENTESLLWAADNRTFFYTVENDAKRQYRLYRYILGTDVHELVYEEEDEAYDLYASRTRSGAWIVVTSESKVTNESRLIPAATPGVEPRLMVPRRNGRRYYPDHRGERFYILADDTGVNFRVVTAPLDQPARWTELVPHREPVMLEELSLFRDHMILRVREHGLPEFEIYDLRKNDGFHRIAFPEPAYSAQPGVNEEFNTTLFRYTYESFVTPRSVYDYDMDAQTAVLLKRTECLGGYDPSRYTVERFFVTARDGAEVPVAMVYRNDVDPRAGNPLLLYGYGSYGSSIPDAFNSNRFSLIDRGITFAIAHIRGGGEMGEAWHDHGRMMEKKNTFHDFIDVAEELIARGYTARETLAIQGGSAGGLLVGAVMNMRPELFKAVVAFVPFVDVMNTMLDASLPLTTQEYVEWGNPHEPQAFAYMKSYDPYSNVERKAYPAMLVRTSLNDSQVGYWEAAKWVARLRACKTDGNELLLHVNMGAGHGGASGRYDKLREQAFDYAWVVRQLGC
jgi:oligopeptidase B